MAEKRRISNIEQGILNDEVRRTHGRETEKPAPGVNSRMEGGGWRENSFDPSAVLPSTRVARSGQAGHGF